MELEKGVENMSMEEIKTKTYEELLIGRISKAFEAMDNSNQDFFDEIVDELEMLFKLKPEMYEQLLGWKKYHQSIAEQSFRLARQKVSMLEGDDIAQRITNEYYQNHIEWSYRKDILESMINVLNAFKMIPFSIPDYAVIESEASIEQQPQPEPEPVIEEQPLPPPTPQPQVQRQVQRPAPIHSPTLKPTNIPRQQPQRQPTPQEQEILREEARAKAEAEEIKRMAMQPQSQTRPVPQPPKKGKFGIFKTE